MTAGPFVVEGVTRWQRTEGSSPCTCCPGEHVYGYDVEGWHDQGMWMHRAIQAFPEGARIRITVESVD